MPQRARSDRLSSPLLGKSKKTRQKDRIAAAQKHHINRQRLSLRFDAIRPTRG